MFSEWSVSKETQHCATTENYKVILGKERMVQNKVSVQRGGHIWAHPEWWDGSNSMNSMGKGIHRRVQRNYGNRNHLQMFEELSLVVELWGKWDSRIGLGSTDGFSVVISVTLEKWLAGKSLLKPPSFACETNLSLTLYIRSLVNW